MKVCSRCKKEKELSEFRKRTTTKAGITGICKPCSNKERKGLTPKQSYQARVSTYIRLYNLPIKLAEKLAEDRVGECPTCGKTKSLVVDHCHTTGRFRGLLCNSCNTTLGHSKDNIKTLENLIKYLKEQNVSQS